MSTATVGWIGALVIALAACSSKSGGRVSSGACLSDKDCRAAGQLCDTTVAACVQCLRAADCATGVDGAASVDCTAGACVSFHPCGNSLDCKGGEVCDTARGRCVACVTDADCGTASHCVASLCRKSCLSDKDCVAAKQLCDPATGSCLECVRSTDCGTGKVCTAGACTDSVCPPGAAACAATTLFVCAPTGTTWQVTAICTGGCRITADGGVCSAGGGS